MRWCCHYLHFTEGKQGPVSVPCPKSPAHNGGPGILNPASPPQALLEVLAIINLLDRQVRQGSFSLSYRWGN